MFLWIKNLWQSIDKKIITIMKKGCLACLGIMLIACLLLSYYHLLYQAPDLYYIGLAVFKLATIFLSFFIICGFAFNEIQKQLN